MVFVSHANPEDNEFALWLALRLAAEGYPVWCDLTKLLGGEVFWSDIEHAIRDRTAKFLYVLTATSNEKPGARNELAVALAVERKDHLKDFVIPLWLDQLAPADFNVEVSRRNAVPFQDGWASGLARVLKKLDQDGIPKKASFGPSAVTAWWRDHVNASAGVRNVPEPLYSNWYPLGPTTLYFHGLGRDDPGSLKIGQKLPFPGVQYEQYLVSFAPAIDFEGKLGSGLFIRDSFTRRLNDPSVPADVRLWKRYRDERNVMTDLLRQVVEHLIEKRALPKYTFANGHQAFYFIKGMLPDDKAWYADYEGGRSWRAMIGYKTMQARPGADARLRYWHFSLEPRPTSHPVLGYTMKPHVLFSDDGTKIWDSHDRLHRARGSQCKDWWNDRWRDLIAAGVSFLAENGPAIQLPVGSATTISVATRPITLESPVSFDEASLEPQEVDDRDDDESDDTDDGGAMEQDESERGDLPE